MAKFDPCFIVLLAVILANSVVYPNIATIVYYSVKGVILAIMGPDLL